MPTCFCCRAQPRDNVANFLHRYCFVICVQIYKGDGCFIQLRLIFVAQVTFIDLFSPTCSCWSRELLERLLSLRCSSRTRCCHLNARILFVRTVVASRQNLSPSWFLDSSQQSLEFSVCKLPSFARLSNIGGAVGSSAAARWSPWWRSGVQVAIVVGLHEEKKALSALAKTLEVKTVSEVAVNDSK